MLSPLKNWKTQKMNLQTKVHSTLTKNLSPNSVIEIESENLCDTHLLISIKSADFTNLSKIDQNKLVYSYLSEYINSGELHAVTLKLTP